MRSVEFPARGSTSPHRSLISLSLKLPRPPSRRSFLASSPRSCPPRPLSYLNISPPSLACRSIGSFSRHDITTRAFAYSPTQAGVGTPRAPSQDCRARAEDEGQARHTVVEPSALLLLHCRRYRRRRIPDGRQSVGETKDHPVSRTTSALLVRGGC